jgi:hypothetical protein
LRAPCPPLSSVCETAPGACTGVLAGLVALTACAFAIFARVPEGGAFLPPPSRDTCAPLAWKVLPTTSSKAVWRSAPSTVVKRANQSLGHAGRYQSCEAGNGKVWRHAARNPEETKTGKKEKHNKKYNTKPMKGTAAHLETLWGKGSAGRDGDETFYATKEHVELNRLRGGRDTPCRRTARGNKGAPIEAAGTGTLFVGRCAAFKPKQK